MCDPRGKRGEHGEFLPVGVRSVRTVKPEHGKRFCFPASTPGSPASSFSPKAVLQRLERRSPPDDIFSWTLLSRVSPTAQ